MYFFVDFLVVYVGMVFCVFEIGIELVVFVNIVGNFLEGSFFSGYRVGLVWLCLWDWLGFFKFGGKCFYFLFFFIWIMLSICVYFLVNNGEFVVFFFYGM